MMIMYSQQLAAGPGHECVALVTDYGGYDDGVAANTLAAAGRFYPAAWEALRMLTEHPQYPGKPLFFNSTGWSLNASRWNYVFVSVQLDGGVLYLCSRDITRAVVVSNERVIVLVRTPERVVPWTYARSRHDAAALAAWLELAASGQLEYVGRTADVHKLVRARLGVS